MSPRADGPGRPKKTRPQGRASLPLTSPPGQHAEERLDVRVRGRIAVAVEVRALIAGRGRAAPCQAREERLDVRVRGRVAVAVEVRAPTPDGARRRAPAVERQAPGIQVGLDSGAL